MIYLGFILIPYKRTMRRLLVLRVFPVVKTPDVAGELMATARRAVSGDLNTRATVG